MTASGSPASGRHAVPAGGCAAASISAIAGVVRTRLAAKSVPAAGSTSRGAKPSAWQVARIASWATGAASRGNSTSARSGPSSASSTSAAAASGSRGGDERAERPAQRRAEPQQRVVERAADERDVDPPVDERGAELRGGVLDGQHAHVGMLRGEPVGERGDAPAGRSGDDAEPQRAGLAGADARDDGLEPLDALHDRARLVEQQRAVGRQLDAARRAHEQLDAERAPRAP